MKNSSTQSRTTQPARLLAIAAVILAGFALLNLAADALMKRQARRGRKVVFNAVDTHGRAFMLLCHEGVETPYYDFLLEDARASFASIQASPGQTTDPATRVACVRYPMDAHSLDLRLAAVPPAPARARRIAVIGDSFTYGEGVPKQRAFPETMQTYADRFGTPGAWQVLNFGLMGQDFPALHIESLRVALKTKPRIVLYVWMPNDTPRGDLDMPEILESAGYFNSRGYLRSVGGPPLARLLHVSSLRRRIGRETIAWYRELNGPRNARGAAELRAHIRAMKRESRAAGAEFRAALFPLLIGKPGAYPLAEEHAFIAGIFKSEGVPVLDLAPAVLDRPARALHVHSSNSHPNVIAHRSSARALANSLGLTKRKLPSLKEQARGNRALSGGLLKRADPMSLEYILALEALEYPKGTVFAAAPECAKQRACVVIKQLKRGAATPDRTAAGCGTPLHPRGRAPVQFCGYCNSRNFHTQ